MPRARPTRIRTHQAWPSSSLPTDSGTTTIRLPVRPCHRIRSLQHFQTTSLAGLLLAGACYNYQPLDNPAPAPGTRVEAELTEAGSLQLAGQIGAGAASVRGEIVESAPDTMLLAITSVLHMNQQETIWNREPVRIPLATVARVQQRRFALEKSVLFGAVVAGGLVAAIKAFQGGGGGGASGGGTGPQPQ